MKILDFWYFDEFKTENPARTAKSSVQRRKKRPESGINATQKEAAGNPTDSYFTIKRKKYQVFIRAIFIFFRKIILIFHYPPQGAATSQSPPYSRLPLRGSCPQSGLKRTIPPPPFSPIFQEKNKKFLKKFSAADICLPSENLRKNFLCVIIFLVEHPGTADAISALQSRKNIVP